MQIMIPHSIEFSGEILAFMGGLLAFMAGSEIYFRAKFIYKIKLSRLKSEMDKAMKTGNREEYNRIYKLMLMTKLYSPNSVHQYTAIAHLSQMRTRSALISLSERMGCNPQISKEIKMTIVSSILELCDDCLECEDKVAKKKDTRKNTKSKL